MAVPMIAVPTAESVAQLGLNCLAVAGGYLAGHVLGGLVAWALDRWVFGGQTPDPLKKLARIVCGAALAILVAIFVFNRGGGTGGGTGEGQGQGSGEPADHGRPAPDEKRPVPVEPPRPADVKTTDPQVRVTFLAGDAAQPAAGKFYLIGDDPTPRTFDDVKAAVEAKKREAAGRQVLLVVLYPANPNHAPPERSPTVTRVTEWAEAAGIRVVLGAGTR